MGYFNKITVFNDNDDEWDYFSLTELETIKGRFNLGVEGNLYFILKELTVFNRNSFYFLIYFD